MSRNKWKKGRYTAHPNKCTPGVILRRGCNGTHLEYLGQKVVWAMLPRLAELEARFSGTSK